MTEQPTLFGTELRRLRLAAGLSLGQLSERVHYSKGYLSKIETGVKLPTPAVVTRCDVAVEANGALALLAPARPAGPWYHFHPHSELEVTEPSTPPAAPAEDAAAGPIGGLAARVRAATGLPGLPGRLRGARTRAGLVAARVSTDLLVLAARYAENIGTYARESGHADAASWWTGQADQLACRGCRAGASISPVRGRNIG